MKYEIRVSKIDYDIHEIYYNDSLYGEWLISSNVDFPEDLTLERDLSYLIDIGIEIGKQMQKDSQNDQTK